jgi:hypothetical protein
MRVDAVESIPECRGAMGEASEDPSVKRALLNFRSAIQSEDSLFEGHPTDAGRLAMVTPVTAYVREILFWPSEARILAATRAYIISSSKD